jgi:putative RNA 2'-phosphotransferase
MNKNVIHISKFLSLVLRHKPEEIDLKLDENGWADVEELIDKVNKRAMKLDLETLDYVVETNSKKRFAFNDDKTKIRASQGHSIEIDLGLEPVQPPEFLYHGTAKANIDSIKLDGIVKRSRQHVHLSIDSETAHMVGSRHGSPHILRIKALEMHNDRYKFYLSANKVWLTDEVPVKYIIF